MLTNVEHAFLTEIADVIQNRETYTSPLTVAIKLRAIIARLTAAPAVNKEALAKLVNDTAIAMPVGASLGAYVADALLASGQLHEAPGEGEIADAMFARAGFTDKDRDNEQYALCLADARAIAALYEAHKKRSGT